MKQFIKIIFFLLAIFYTNISEAKVFAKNTTYDQARPKAYLNWILFDDQFKYVSSCSNADQVGNDSQLKIHLFTGLPITKSGYLYVYLSNESGVDVFFDNLQVTHIRGPLLEETHYYPGGLVMSGISSKSLNFGSPTNRKKFNGKEEQRQKFSDGSGLEWLDFGAREYDNQILRWMVVDPKAEKYLASSPYNFVDNNPINRIDPTGKDWYRDNTGGLKFDLKVQSQKDLKDGQSYVGDTSRQKQEG